MKIKKSWIRLKTISFLIRENFKAFSREFSGPTFFGQYYGLENDPRWWSGLGGRVSSKSAENRRKTAEI